MHGACMHELSSRFVRPLCLRRIRLVSLAAQRFIAEVVHDSLQ